MRTANHNVIHSALKRILRSLRLFALIALVSMSLLSCSTMSLSGKQAVVTDSEDVQLLLTQAMQAETDGDIETANNYYEQMMEKGAKSPNALNRYAVFLKNELEIEKAEAVYLQALELSPHHANTHFNIGILYELYRGDLDKALSHYQSYQAYTEADDKQVAMWIRDLENRLKLASKTNVEE